MKAEDLTIGEFVKLRGWAYEVKGIMFGTHHVKLALELVGSYDKQGNPKQRVEVIKRGVELETFGLAVIGDESAGRGA